MNHPREMTQKAKLSLVAGGILLPICLIYFIYQNLLDRYTQSTFNFADLTFAYEHQVIRETDGSREDVVILGDSTGKSALNPEELHSTTSINLATNVGNALSSFYIMNGYLRHHPAPQCFVLSFQYNWKHSYQHFFEWMPYYDVLSLSDLVSVWSRSVGKDFFPADRMGFFPYLAKSLMSYLRLNDLHLAELQSALGRQVEFSADEVRSRFIAEKGFQDNSVRRHLAGEDFFNLDFHIPYFKNFEASPAEDYYLQQMAELTRAHHANLLIVATPAAESEEATRSSAFFSGRHEHLQKIFAGKADVEVFNEEPVRPRSEYFDFTHMNREGALAFSRRLDLELAKRCLGRKAI